MVSKKYKDDARLTIARVYDDTDDRVDVEIQDINSGASVTASIDLKSLMDAILGKARTECVAKWSNVDKLGYKIISKTKNVPEGKLDEYLVDGWFHHNGYGNHHRRVSINDVAYYSTTFRKFVKDE